MYTKENRTFPVHSNINHPKVAQLEVARASVYPKVTWVQHLCNLMSRVVYLLHRSASISSSIRRCIYSCIFWVLVLHVSFRHLLCLKMGRIDKPSLDLSVEQASQFSDLDVPEWFLDLQYGKSCSIEYRYLVRHIFCARKSYRKSCSKLCWSYSKAKDELVTTISKMASSASRSENNIQSQYRSEFSNT